MIIIITKFNTKSLNIGISFIFLKNIIINFFLIIDIYCNNLFHEKEMTLFLFLRTYNLNKIKGDKNLLKKSFSKITKKPTKNSEEMPLLAALTIEKLEENAEVINAAPLVCKFCGGILTDHERLKKIDENTYSWQCEFCYNENKISIMTNEEKSSIEKTESMTSENLSIIFEEISKRKAEEEQKEKIDEKDVKSQKEKFVRESLAAIIDISGSMYGGKLEAVKHSLVQTVKDIKVNNPQTIFCLITFTNYIDIFATPTNIIKISDDNELQSKSKLKKSLEHSLKNIVIGSVGEFADQWIEKVESLRTIGWTALGPGLYSGQIVLEEKILKNGKKNARIILLTDGLANVGMGRVEDVSEKKALEFYTELANECLKLGIIIDVIGVADPSNKVALNIIGKITDITGGEMVLIKSEQIESVMETLRSKKYIARNAILRVFTPDYLELDSISGAFVSGDIPKKAGSPINLGALDPDREIYLHFVQKKEIEEKKVPIQIQLNYIDKKNIEKIRVLRTNIETTDNIDEYSSEYDAELYTNFKIQEAGKYYQNFEPEKAQNVLSTLKSELSSGYLKQSRNIDSANDLILNEEAEWEEADKQLKQDMYDDVQSVYSSIGQKYTRKSLSRRKFEAAKRKSKKN